MGKIQNYVWKDLPQAANGDTIEDCLLGRIFPHTKIYEGVTGLKFVRCNLRNCDLPPDAQLEDCKQVNLHVSLCSNLHPEWVVDGITTCSENCEHVASTDTITIDGASITMYHYEDKRVE